MHVPPALAPHARIEELPLLAHGRKGSQLSISVAMGRLDGAMCEHEDGWVLQCSSVSASRPVLALRNANRSTRSDKILPDGSISVDKALSITRLTVPIDTPHTYRFGPLHGDHPGALIEGQRLFELLPKVLQPVTICLPAKDSERGLVSLNICGSCAQERGAGL
jgi:hypothetical protein